MTDSGHFAPQTAVKSFTGIALVCRREAKLQIGCIRFDRDRQVPGNAVSMKISALARSGSEGYRGEKPLSFLPPTPLTSMHTGSHLSEDPGCQHKRKLRLDTMAHLGLPPLERCAAPDSVWILPFVSSPLGTRLDKFAGTDVISSRCHWRLHQAGTHVAQRHRQECAQTSVGYIISLGGRRGRSVFFVLHQKTAGECNVGRGARHSSCLNRLTQGSSNERSKKVPETSLKLLTSHEISQCGKSEKHL